MISRSTLIGALVVVELAILGAAAKAIGGGSSTHTYFGGPRHIGMVFSDGAAPVSSKLDKTFPVGPAPHVVLDVDNATVLVQAGQAGSVRVLGSMTVSGHVRGVPALTAVRTEDGVRVAVESSLVQARIVREVRLTVPPDARVEIESASAVDARGLHAKLVARIGDGSIRVVGHRGDLDLTTGSGDVDLLDVRAETIAAHTGSGALKLTSAGADHIDAHTDSGAIAAISLRAVDGSLVTDSGRIDVTFAPDSDAAVNLHTDYGRIDGAGPAAQGDDSADSRSVRLGSARGRFNLSTGSGPIAVTQGAQV